MIKHTKAQTSVRISLGLFFIIAGISHLSFMRKEFLAQVPNWLSIDPDTVVFLSGIAEIILGLSLLFLLGNMARVGWMAALFLLAVFPGNIAQLVNHKDAFGLNSDLLRWLRLPLQPLLIFLVLWSTGALANWRKR